ncbi:MAG: helix-turn-helix transcriptional regulator [Chloroflexota bacterium]
MNRKTDHVGSLIKYWRSKRRMSQYDLASESGISTKHLSFVETGKSRPSQKLLNRFSQVLGLSLQNQNSLFLAAGYAPKFTKAPIHSDSMIIIDNAIDHILKGHDPYPTLVVDSNYDIIKANQGYKAVVDCFLGDGSSHQFTNVYSLMFEQEGLQPFIQNWPLFESNLLGRLLQEANATQNEQLKLLYEDLKALRPVSKLTVADSGYELPILDFTLEKENISFRFFSMLTTFGTPLDVTVQNLRIESMFPADERTKQLLADL